MLSKPQLARARSGTRQAPRSRCGSKFIFILGVVSFLSQLTAAAPVKEIRRVLVFYEWSVAGPGIAKVDREIRAALTQQSSFQIELYTENLETNLFPDESSQREFREWFVHKYRDRKPDLVIAEGPPSIKFMADSHQRILLYESANHRRGWHRNGFWEQRDGDRGRSRTCQPGSCVFKNSGAELASRKE